MPRCPKFFETKTETEGHPGLVYRNTQLPTIEEIFQVKDCSTFTGNRAAMPLHDNKKELKRYLQQNNFFDQERWERMEEYGLETMEDVAHAFGDMSKPVEETRLLEILQYIEYDWTTETHLRDDQGDLRWTPKFGIHIDPDDAWDKTNYDKVIGCRSKPYNLITKWRGVIYHCRAATLNAVSKILEAGEDGKTEKATHSERMDRRTIMQKEFKEHNPGMLERETCPGVRCEDLFYDFMFLNRVREYPHPEMCTSEDQEGEAEEMRKKKCRYDNPKDGKKKNHRRPMCEFDRRIDFLHDLTRRSIACHLSGVMRFKEHEQWVASLRHTTNDVNVTGSVSIAQALKADRHMWQISMQETREGIRKEGNDHPCFVEMQKAKKE